MISSWWVGVLLGLLLAGVSSLVRAVTHVYALRATEVSVSLLATVHGILLRAVVVLGGLALILGLAPVHKVAVSATVIAVLIVSIISEVATIWNTLGDKSSS